MILKYTACLAFLATGICGCGMFRETVRLEYKLQPGAQLVYKSSATATLTCTWGEMDEAYSGTERFIVAGVEDGVMLIGKLPPGQVSSGDKSPAGGKSDEKTSDQISVCRIDRAGRPAGRTIESDGKMSPGFPEVLCSLRYTDIPEVALSAAPVAIGDHWESVTESPMRAIAEVRASAKVVSTLAEIRTVEGRRCAVIRSKLSPAGKGFGVGLFSLAVSGESEALFDIEGGFTRSERSRLAVKGDLGRGPQTGTVETSFVLDSIKDLPPEEAASEIRVVRAFALAIGHIHEGQYSKAAEALEGLNPAELPEPWKERINKTIAEVKQVAQSGRGPTGVPVVTSEASLLAAANYAEAAQRWTEAIAKLTEFADNLSGGEMAEDALSRAADIYEQKLNDKKSADELRHRIIANQERIAAHPGPFVQYPIVELYKLAETYERYGEPEKAVATYRFFLTKESPQDPFKISRFPSNARIVAQSRIGGLLEKLGKSSEAIEAYKAVGTMPGDDDWAKNVKEMAKRNADRLSAAAPK